MRLVNGWQAEVSGSVCREWWWTNILYINNFHPDSADTLSVRFYYRSRIPDSGAQTIHIRHSTSLSQRNRCTPCLMHALKVEILSHKMHTIIKTTATPSSLAKITLNQPVKPILQNQTATRPKSMKGGAKFMILSMFGCNNTCISQAYKHACLEVGKVITYMQKEMGSSYNFYFTYLNTSNSYHFSLTSY